MPEAGSRQRSARASLADVGAEAAADEVGLSLFVTRRRQRARAAVCRCLNVLKGGCERQQQRRCAQGHDRAGRCGEVDGKRCDGARRSIRAEGAISKIVGCRPRSATRVASRRNLPAMRSARCSARRARAPATRPERRCDEVESRRASYADARYRGGARPFRSTTAVVRRLPRRTCDRTDHLHEDGMGRKTTGTAGRRSPTDSVLSPIVCDDLSGRTSARLQKGSKRNSPLDHHQVNQIRHDVATLDTMAIASAMPTTTVSCRPPQRRDRRTRRSRPRG